VDLAGQRSDGIATAIHREAAHGKILGLIAFVVAVVATPPRAVWPYAVHLLVLLVVVLIARVPAGRLARGALIEIPFLLFAVVLPFVADGPTVTVLGGIEVSEPGLWAAGSLLAKATLSVLATLVLAYTTTPLEFLGGLRRLRFPAALTEILSFMLRYQAVVGEQWRRMSIARASRGFTPRTPAAWPVLGNSLGVLFIRSFELGERVHLAMLARGYTGTFPTAVQPPAARAHWAALAIAPAVAASTTILAWQPT
jgi:cobalt/nickel transport system permease protein